MEAAMKDALSAALALVGRRKNLVIGMLALLIGIVSVLAWYVSTHSRIDGVWQRHIYPDYDERLTFKRADGQEFEVLLTGMKMNDGTVVPYDIGLLCENDPPLTVFFEDVHYVDRSGKSYEWIAIDDPQRPADARRSADESLGPAGRRISSTGKYAVLADRNGVATFGKHFGFVPTLAGGGTLTKIEIVTPYSLVKRVQEQPMESPFR
jgi:hypothetical protein